MRHERTIPLRAPEAPRALQDSAVAGSIKPSRPTPASVGSGWDRPIPYLSQPRAQSALRHQLTAIFDELEPALERRRAEEPHATFEMHVLPHRLIARLADTGISFSWVGAVGGQAPTVSEGRLLVIQWAGVETQMRGVAALRSARPMRERIYCPEAADSEHWGWRVDGSDGPACSTSALVAEWLAGCGTRG